MVQKLSSVLYNLFKKIKIKINVIGKICNMTLNNSQTTNILNTHQCLYFQVTKITYQEINALLTSTLTVYGKFYSLISVICNHGESMTGFNYTPK